MNPAFICEVDPPAAMWTVVFFFFLIEIPGFFKANQILMLIRWTCMGSASFWVYHTVEEWPDLKVNAGVLQFLEALLGTFRDSKKMECTIAVRVVSVW